MLDRRAVTIYTSFCRHFPGLSGSPIRRTNMALVRWSPVSQLAGMEVDQLNRMFNELYQDSFARGWTPAVDIYETEAHDVVIKAELPEMKREDISLTFENNVLTLKGERQLEQEVKRDSFHRIERRHGS